jgi:hypothetical protein
MDGQPVYKFATPEGKSCSQEPAACPYPVPDGPDQHHHVLFHIIFLHLRGSPKLTLLRVSPLTVSVHFCGHVARMADKRCISRDLVGRSEGK